jgi:hypothetical protein
MGAAAQQRGMALDPVRAGVSRAVAAWMMTVWSFPATIVP